MAGELNEQAVEVTIKGTKISLVMLQQIIRSLLDKKNQRQYGEQKLEKLNKQGKKLESIDLPNQDLKNFKKILKKYEVDFSIMKEKGKDEYTIFFKGQDIDRVYKGLENCLNDLDLEKGKKPIKEVIKEAIEKSTEKNKEVDSKQKNREKNRDRGERT